MKGNNATCYTQLAVDQHLGAALGIPAYAATTLRSIYDSENPDAPVPINITSKETDRLNEWASKIKAMLNINDEASRYVAMNHAGSNLSETVRTVKQNFTSRELEDRISLVSNIISARLDHLEAAYGVSREALINGVMIDGKMVGGQFNLFEYAYQTIKSARDKWANSKLDQAPIMVQKFDQTLQSWGALSFYIRSRLKLSEGVLLSNDLGSVGEADVDDFNDNMPSDIFDMSEAVRDSWMEKLDLKPAFGSVGMLTRRILSKIPVTYFNDQGNLVYAKDDLGFYKYMNPVTAHQMLVEELRGVTDVKGMIARLQNSLLPFAPMLVDVFKKNERAAKAFHSDMRKNFQLYTGLKEKYNPDGSLDISTPTLNTVQDVLTPRYKMRVFGVDFRGLKGRKSSNGKNTLDPNAIYATQNPDGSIARRVNWENYKKFVDLVTNQNPFAEKQNTAQTGNVFTGAQQYSKSTYYDKRNFIVQVGRFLGLEIDASIADNIIRNRRDTKAFLQNLDEILAGGNREIIDKQIGGGIIRGRQKSTNQAFEDVFLMKDSSSSILKNIKALNKLIGKHTYGNRYDNKINCKSTKGKNIVRYSNVYTSFLGDRIELIKSYVENNDKEGLKRFIESNYLISAYFYDIESASRSGSAELQSREKFSAKYIRNRWLKEMYEACENTKTSLSENKKISNLDWDRFLGTTDMPVEKFIQKKDAVTMIMRYFDASFTGDPNKASYPVFILGDSGATKYITFNRYSTETVENEMYNVYLQEIERQKLVEAADTKLKDAGYAGIQNFDKTGKEFTMLPFLNDGYEENGQHKNIDASTDPAIVKRIIREHLEQGAEQFIQDMTRLGLMEKIESGKYKYLHKFIDKAKADIKGNQDLHEQYIKDKLKEFYYNYKFATIEQLQLMTVDTAFYGLKVVKDDVTGMDKVIGRAKDLQKRYKEIHAPGTPIATENDIMRAVYFDDIEHIARNEFLKVIERTHGRDSDVYKEYLHNSLTDGQGYRSLTGYKKVLEGMGMWDAQKEKVYQYIMELRNTYTKQGLEVPAEELTKLEKMSVIFQPIKPYYFGHEQLPINQSTKESLLIPVQLKYAEAVIIPELHPKNSMLRHIGLFMENNDIDVVASTKCVKVGAFGQAKLTDLASNDTEILADRAAKGNTNTEISDEQRVNWALSKGYQHELNYYYYRVQQNVPESTHHSRLVGTQQRKIITANVLKRINDPSSPAYGTVAPETVEEDGFYHYEKYMGNQPINVNGTQVRLSGRNFLRFYTGLHAALMFKSFDRLSDALSSEDKISNMLMQDIINNSRVAIESALGYALDDVDGKKDFHVQLADGSTVYDVEAAFWSLFTNIVNKQKTNGGSCVQESALGLTDTKEDGSLDFIYEYEIDNEGNKHPVNILAAQCEIPFLLSYKDHNGAEHQLEYDDYCHPDGTLKTDEQGNNLIEKDYPGILDIIAYRIPTEHTYSMMNLRVVRFSRATEGGTIKVPLEATTISGFDFDVDKLFFLRKEFREAMPEFKRLKLDRQQRNTIMGSIAQTHPEFVRIVDPVIEDDFSNTQLFSICQKIYAKYPNIKKDLDRLRAEDKNKGSILSYWNKSAVAEEEAKKQGFASAEEFKKFLITDTASDAGIIPEALRVVSKGYITWNEEALANAGMTKGQLFKEAAAAADILLIEEVKPAERWVEYDTKISAMENDEVACNNMLLHLTRQRLMDKETLEMRTTPNGFEQSKKAARIQRELMFGNVEEFYDDRIGECNVEALQKYCADKKNPDPEPEYDPSEPVTWLTYKQMNQAAGDLIGIFANQDSNHLFCSMMERFEMKQGKEIEFAGHTAAEGYGRSLLVGANGINLDKVMAEFLAASVDAVKNPVLNFLNLNPLTADVACLLARLSYSPNEIGMLLNQPIIRKICEHAMDKNMRLGEAIIDIKRQYETCHPNLAKFSMNKDAMGRMLSMNKLAGNIAYNRLNPDAMSIDKGVGNEAFVEDQLYVLELFQNVASAADELTKFVQSTKFTSSNSISSNAGDMYASVDRTIDYMNQDEKESVFNIELSRSGLDVDKRPLRVDEALLNIDGLEYARANADNPFAYEQTMFDNIRKAIRLFGKYLPYENPQYNAVRQVLKGMARNEMLDGTTINDIHLDVLVSMLASQEFSLFNGEMPVKMSDGSIISAKDYYINHFPRIVFKRYQEDEDFRNLPIFQYLTPVLEDEDDLNSNIKLKLHSVSGLESKGAMDVMDSWDDLLKIEPDLAKDLYLYCFHNAGYDFSGFNFIKWAPVGVKEALRVPLDGEDRTFLQFLKEAFHDGIHINPYDFARRYILNNPDNRRFIYHIISDTAKSFIEPLACTKDKKGNIIGYKDSFVLDVSGKDGNESSALSSMFVLKAEGDVLHFVPAIRIGDAMYMATSGSDAFNVATSGTQMTYVRVEMMGQKGTAKDYTPNATSNIGARNIDTTVPLSTGSDFDSTSVGGNPAFNRAQTIETLANEYADAYMQAINSGVINDAMMAQFVDPQGDVRTQLYEMCRRMLNSKEDEELNALAETLRKACRENGILLMDADGSLKQGC